MDKFTYFERSLSETLTSDKLKEYGAMGWELVNFSDNGKEGNDRFHYVFKKKIELLCS